MPSLRPSLILLVACALALAGCATADFSPDRILRPATATPERFLIGSLTETTLTEPTPTTGCRSPMVDPRDGTRLLLQRSGNHQGDYAVPLGRYGVGPGEWLRLDCTTGQPIGIVKK